MCLAVKKEMGTHLVFNSIGHLRWIFERSKNRQDVGTDHAGLDAKQVHEKMPCIVNHETGFDKGMYLYTSIYLSM
jgi:hypothetical protein